MLWLKTANRTATATNVLDFSLITILNSHVSDISPREPPQRKHVSEPRSALACGTALNCENILNCFLRRTNSHVPAANKVRLKRYDWIMRATVKQKTKNYYLAKGSV